MNRVMPFLATLCLLAMCDAGPVRASACDSPSTIIEQVICNSADLKALELRVDEATARIRSVVEAPVAKALDRDDREWRRSRDRCETEKLPQQCLEWSFYERLELLTAMTGLFAGPRHFGDPLRVCWKISESEEQAERCLDKRLNEARTGAELMAAHIEDALAKRDRQDGAAGDALASFHAAQEAFGTYADALCLSEASALGEGVGRKLGRIACVVRQWQARTLDMERLVPGRRSHWSESPGRAADMLEACRAVLPEGIDREKTRLMDVADGGVNGPALRLGTGKGKRIDCLAPEKAGGPPRAVPVSRDDKGIAEGYAVFTPDPAEPLRGTCYEAVRFNPPSGTGGGWMSYRVC